MNLQTKFALYNTFTKIAVILVLSIIIMLSIEKISYNHLDNRLIKNKNRLINNINDSQINNLVKEQNTFTDYNILKNEFIVLKKLKPNAKISSSNTFLMEKREIEGNIEIYRILDTSFKYKENKYFLEIGITMTVIESIKEIILFYMFVVLVISLFITYITDYKFTNFILKPFYQIIDQKINKVNNPTAYSYKKIPTNTKDFRILDESINILMRKISDLFSLEKEFIANVSHELLTPISILTTRLENILNAENLSAAHEEKLVASLKTLARLKNTINSLLLISEVENAQYHKHDDIYLKNEIAEICIDLEDRIADKKIKVINNMAVGHYFKGNKALIHTLLINIINNAIKYNKQGGTITIDEVIHPNNYQLIFTDTGIGMNETQLKKVFKRFERANTQSGHGLGLAIANGIAKFHQHKLDINSTPKTGTTFKIIIPID